MKISVPLDLFRWLGAAASFRARSPDRRVPASGLTFCIAHFNGADFLEVTLHAIRRYHPDARIVVADSQSVWPQFAEARTLCNRFSAEMHPLIARHKHTGLLNYLFRQIRTETGVFLDQDCVLLEPLDRLRSRLKEGALLAGPRDEMRVTHPNACARYPGISQTLFRTQRDFIHASLMLVNAAQLRSWVGRHPFSWEAEWGRPSTEPYYGLTERIRRRDARGLFWLHSQHTGYGMGTAYLYQDRPIAFHNWYSGRVFGQREKMDGTLDPDWLRAEKARFIQDYWAGTIRLDLPATA